MPLIGFCNCCGDCYGRPYTFDEDYEAGELSDVWEATNYSLNYVDTSFVRTHILQLRDGGKAIYLGSPQERNFECAVQGLTFNGLDGEDDVRAKFDLVFGWEDANNHMGVTIAMTKFPSNQVSSYLELFKMQGGAKTVLKHVFMGVHWSALQYGVGEGPSWRVRFDDTKIVVSAGFDSELGLLYYRHDGTITLPGRYTGVTNVRITGTGNPMSFSSFTVGTLSEEDLPTEEEPACLRIACQHQFGSARGGGTLPPVSSTDVAEMRGTFGPYWRGTSLIANAEDVISEDTEYGEFLFGEALPYPHAFDPDTFNLNGSFFAPLESKHCRGRVIFHAKDLNNYFFVEFEHRLFLCRNSHARQVARFKRW